jgi:hypothetical protein
MPKPVPDRSDTKAYGDFYNQLVQASYNHTGLFEHLPGFTGIGVGNEGVGNTCTVMVEDADTAEFKSVVESIPKEVVLTTEDYGAHTLAVLYKTVGILSTDDVETE